MISLLIELFASIFKGKRISNTAKQKPLNQAAADWTNVKNGRINNKTTNETNDTKTDCLN